VLVFDDPPIQLRPAISHRIHLEHAWNDNEPLLPRQRRVESGGDNGLVGRLGHGQPPTAGVHNGVAHSKHERYEPLCSRHVRAIWLADHAEQGFLFRLDATTVNVADFKEEDDQAEAGMIERKLIEGQHPTIQRLSRLPRK
jgi:hypothetical protein